MELSGKVIIFENEEQAKLWFDSINSVEEKRICESAKMKIESFINMCKGE